MGEVDYESHFASSVGKQTITMLMSYHEFGVLSRTFMLKEHAKMLEKIRMRKGKYQKYTESNLLFLESCVYQELIECLCHLIEDFSTLCYALWDDLANLPKRIITPPKLKNILDKLIDDSHWFTLLRYPDPASLNFTVDDKAFLKRHYNRNIDVHRNFVKLLRKFIDIDLYWLFYNKRKHGNTLIYGLEKVEIHGESTILIPVAYNSKYPDKLKGIPFSYSMYKKNQKLFDTLAILVRDLLMRAILFIERNGVYVIEHVSYYQMKAEDKARLTALIQEYDKNVKHSKITVNVKMELDTKYLDPFYNFYDNFDIGAFNR